MCIREMRRSTWHEAWIARETWKADYARAREILPPTHPDLKAMWKTVHAVIRAERKAYDEFQATDCRCN